jgi:hypothetical protein
MLRARKDLFRAEQVKVSPRQAPKSKELSCPEPHGAVIRVYGETGNVIKTHELKGDFKES